MSSKAGLTYANRNKAAPYAEALRMVGVEPVWISAAEPRSLDGLQGLLLTGGTDVNPICYGQSPHPQTQAPDDARDALESDLLRKALERDLPVLAICRGMQLLNVVHGGTLIQHVDHPENHAVRPQDPSVSAHEIVVQPGTRLAGILGVGRLPVNSRHHQAVDRKGTGLVVAARAAEDGLVEALERTDRRFVLAVQWHPEDQFKTDQTQRRLFEAFAEILAEGGPGLV